MAAPFGYFKLDNRHPLPDIRQSVEGYGYVNIKGICSDACYLGTTDLQPIDTSKLPPAASGLTAVVCGETYDYDLRAQIVALYHEGRLNELARINGSFAAAIYDEAAEKLTLVNDRYGLIKLYYYHDGTRFCFAPRIRLLKAFGADMSLRTDALPDFFVFSFLLSDKTFFENIYQLPAASILEVSRGSLSLSKYWDYTQAAEYDDRSEEELIEELGSLFQQAVATRVHPGEKLIVPLSGGLDSRAILAAARECTSSENIITFTFGEKGSFDFEIGTMVAREAGVAHIPLRTEKLNLDQQYDLLMPDTEGMVEVTPYFAPDGYQRMAEYGGRLYIGYMGDPLMGSHITADMLDKKMTSEQDYIEARSIAFRNNRLNEIDDVAQLLNPRYMHIEEFRSSFHSTFDEIDPSACEDMSNYCNRWDYRNRQYKCVTPAVFRYTEQLQYETPFLDNELVDFTLRLSPCLKFREKLYKSMLLARYPKLFSLPCKNNLGRSLTSGEASMFLAKATVVSKARANKMANRLIHRNLFPNRSKNYIDYGDFLRRDKPYRDYIRKMLDRVNERGYFNSDSIGQMWDSHMRGRRDFCRFFGLAATIELLLEAFVDA